MTHCLSCITLRPVLLFTSICGYSAIGGSTAHGRLQKSALFFASPHPREEQRVRDVPEYECCVPSLESSEVPPMAQMPSFLLMAFLKVLAMSLLFTSWNIYNWKGSVRVTRNTIVKWEGCKKEAGKKATFCFSALKQTPWYNQQTWRA